MYKKIIILFPLIFFGACSHYIHTTSARTSGNVSDHNRLLETLTIDKVNRDYYLNFGKSIYPKVSNLPSSNDVENKVWAPPKIINMTNAFYETDKIGQEGNVLIATLISESGEVIISKIVESSNDNLNKSATATVTRWKILPATIDGKPSKSVLFLPFTFKNDPDSSPDQNLAKGVIGDAHALQSLLIGTWRPDPYSELRPPSKSTYHDDGTLEFVAYNSYKCDVLFKASGVWRIEDDELHILMQSSERTDLMPVPLEIIDEVVSITESSKVLRAKDNGNIQHRIKSDVCNNK
ncbi:energy transducer TonB [Methylotenera sp. N17]|uniref:energy transducer TonB n=1 Tax=Methylotenera sp. N17 TaxID=1502761 RepID=UPI0006477EB8|nr:energy transducer TonB [Methylotenera sp. N17]